MNTWALWLSAPWKWNVSVLSLRVSGTNKWKSPFCGGGDRDQYNSLSVWIYLAVCEGTPSRLIWNPLAEQHENWEPETFRMSQYRIMQKTKKTFSDIKRPYAWSVLESSTNSYIWCFQQLSAFSKKSITNDYHGFLSENNETITWNGYRHFSEHADLHCARTEHIVFIFKVNGMQNDTQLFWESQNWSEK